MQWHSNPFTLLAIQVRDGEDSAAEEFRENMKPQLERMVRRVLRLGARHSPWGPKILAEAQRLVSRSQGQFSLVSERVIVEVAELLCDAIIDQLQAGRRMQDTWAPAPVAMAATEMALC